MRRKWKAWAGWPAVAGAPLRGADLFFDSLKCAGRGLAHLLQQFATKHRNHGLATGFDDLYVRNRPKGSALAATVMNAGNGILITRSKAKGDRGSDATAVRVLALGNSDDCVSHSCEKACHRN